MRRASASRCCCTAPAMYSRETESRATLSSSRTKFPSASTEPMANSGFPGAPILWARQTSRGACKALATSKPTGTPPQGMARMTAASPLKRASASARFRPASARFWNTIIPCLLPCLRPGQPLKHISRHGSPHRPFQAQARSHPREAGGDDAEYADKPPENPRVSQLEVRQADRPRGGMAVLHRDGFRDDGQDGRLQRGLHPYQIPRRRHRAPHVGEPYSRLRNRSRQGRRLFLSAPDDRLVNLLVLLHGGFPGEIAGHRAVDQRAPFRLVGEKLPRAADDVPQRFR